MYGLAYSYTYDRRMACDDELRYLERRCLREMGDKLLEHVGFDNKTVVELTRDTHECPIRRQTQVDYRIHLTPVTTRHVVFHELAEPSFRWPATERETPREGRFERLKSAVISATQHGIAACRVAATHVAESRERLQRRCEGRDVRGGEIALIRYHENAETW